MLKIKDLSPNLIRAEYAVRGPIVKRALELQAQGKEIIWCNIGNPQEFDQQPLTYLRASLALMIFPELLEAEIETKANKNLIPKDLRQKASEQLKESHNLGQYTMSQGLLSVRESIAQYIEERDKIKANAQNIILTDGASQGIKMILQSLISSANSGIMTPLPQYPLYSASIVLFGGQLVPYYLDEDNNWQINLESLEKSLKKAKQTEIKVKAIVVINPSNPTGSILDQQTIETIIKFAAKHKLVILADEVYQNNIFRGNKFVSFAKVLNDLEEKDVPLFSFHSGSKSIGECGFRFGYLEMRNITQDVIDQFIKFQSISLCANHPGQAALKLMADPPQPEEISFELFHKELFKMNENLEKKAMIMYKGLNGIKGIFCSKPQGAMYAFPRLENLPKNITDTKYCFDLLEETGIVFVPGTGFGQLPNTKHFRTTFLPTQKQIEMVLEKLAKFHKKFTR